MEGKGNNPAFSPIIGVTVRDYFAAKAMQAILSNQELFLKVLESQEDKTIKSSDALANNSYAMADSMLTQREK